MHDALPVELWYLPLAQVEHEVYACELELWYLPVEHLLHMFPFLYRPVIVQ